MRDAGRIGFAIKGEYNSSEIYEKLDVVYYDFSSYVALKNTTGNLPTNSEYWQMIAKGYEFGFSYSFAESVASLPAVGKIGVFYLVPNQEASMDNRYDEYIYIPDFGYEKIGELQAEVDLSGYVTEDQLSSELLGYMKAADAEGTFVQKSGDTMTGKLNVITPSGGGGFHVKNKDNEEKVWLGIGSGGINHGVHSNKLGRWLIFGNNSKTIIPGEAVIQGNEPIVGNIRMKNYNVPDNGGRQKLLLMWDVTDWYNTQGSEHIENPKGFSGMIICIRNSDYTSRYGTADITICANYDKKLAEANPLFTNYPTQYCPMLVHRESDDTYHLAMKISGSGRTITLVGTFLNYDAMENEWVLFADRESFAEGYELVKGHKVITYPSAIKATQDAEGNVINTTYIKNGNLPIATESSIGGIKPDGTTITVDENGVATAKSGEITEEFLLENYVKKSGGDISKTLSGIFLSNSRILPSAGSTIDVNFGRINKYLSDLKTVAFNGYFSNLLNVPVKYIRSIRFDAWEAAYIAEYAIPSFGSNSFILVNHNGASSTLSNTGADDRQVIWAIFPGWFSGTSTSTTSPPVRIVSLGSRGSTSRGAIASVSSEIYSSHIIKVSVPKGSVGEFYFFAFGPHAERVEINAR